MLSQLLVLHEGNFVVVILIPSSCFLTDQARKRWHGDVYTENINKLLMVRFFLAQRVQIMNSQNRDYLTCLYAYPNFATESKYH